MSIHVSCANDQGIRDGKCIQHCMQMCHYYSIRVVHQVAEPHLKMTTNKLDYTAGDYSNEPEGISSHTCALPEYPQILINIQRQKTCSSLQPICLPFQQHKLESYKSISIFLMVRGPQD